MEAGFDNETCTIKPQLKSNHFIFIINEHEVVTVRSNIRKLP